MFWYFINNFNNSRLIEYTQNDLFLVKFSNVIKKITLCTVQGSEST